MSHVAANLRGSDRAEVFASHGQTGAEAVFTSVAMSCHVRGIVGDDGQPAGLCGVTRRGVIWLLATPALVASPSHRWQFLRAGRLWVNRMLATFRRLENWCDARNTATVRWLRGLGFTVHPPAPFGKMGLPFHHFTRLA
ncbi:MAG: hypothetical protein ABMA26_16160 [Limisphaerales bacterium]